MAPSALEDRHSRDTGELSYDRIPGSISARAWTPRKLPAKVAGCMLKVRAPPSASHSLNACSSMHSVPLNEVHILKLYKQIKLDEGSLNCLHSS